MRCGFIFISQVALQSLVAVVCLPTHVKAYFYIDFFDNLTELFKNLNFLDLNMQEIYFF